ncbi:general secretion pathway protein GspE [Desulfuromonas carbonis]|uniref:GspE/PulE/PilB domain-containing protein n=1 Tax=Desulfuromonas sp. DDH964 TaxID=1823759 RepID=UPI00078D0123|nr:hypothetical protein [Desulfuromonas sp. DDH964]AMV73426.1 GspIIEN domain-containing protein [Desulfuromonas sp. DDH964]
MAIRLGDLLLQEKLITTAQLEEALKYQVIFGGKLGTNLIEMGAIDEATITRVLSRKFGVPAVDPDELLQIPPQALQVLPRELAEKYRVVPLRLNNRRLALVMTDPSDLKVLDEIAFRTGCIIQPLVATELRIVHVLEQAYGIPRERRYINVLPEMGGGNRPFGAKPVAPPAPQPKPQPAAVPVVEIPDLEAPVEEEIVELAAADELIEVPPVPPVPPAPVPPPEVPPAPVTLGEELIAARNRDDILDAMARFLGGEFLYSAILLVRGEVALGWKATASAREVPGFGDLEIPLDEASVLKTVAETRGYHLGPLPRTPFNSMFLQGMGGRVPERALLVPLLMMGRVVAILYVDAPGIELGPLLPELQKLTAKAAMAFEILVLQNKILSL